MADDSKNVRQTVFMNPHFKSVAGLARPLSLNQEDGL